MKPFTMPNQKGWLLSNHGGAPCFHPMDTALPTGPAWDVQMCFTLPTVHDVDEATRLPHPCWVEAKTDTDRHPRTVEEWDWRADFGEGQAKVRSEKRLNVAGDYADPRAPNQMAMVLRMDLIRTLGDLQWHRARGNLFFEKGETPPIDIAYSRINALGGTVTADDKHGAGYVQAIDDVLKILTGMGAKDAPLSALMAEAVR